MSKKTQTLLPLMLRESFRFSSGRIRIFLIHALLHHSVRWSTRIAFSTTLSFPNARFEWMFLGNLRSNPGKTARVKTKLERHGFRCAALANAPAGGIAACSGGGIGPLVRSKSLQQIGRLHSGRRRTPTHQKDTRLAYGSA
jgi:hypothetical protein